MSGQTWYYVDAAGQQQGPVGLHDLLSLRVRGAVNDQSLVWREGWADWRSLAEALADAGASRSTAPAPTAIHTAPAAAPRAMSAVVPAGFLRRWAALFIDNLLLSVAAYVIAIVAAIVLGMAGSAGGFDDSSNALVAGLTLGFYLAYFAAAMTYHAACESSDWQGSIGKRALGIKVVDADGGRLSFGRAALRWLSALLSYATLYGGFLMALFTARKETLHDKITGTQVVDRWAYTEWPDRQRDGLGGCGVAAAVGGGILLLVGLIGIVAAIALPAYQDYVGRAKVAEVLAAANVAKVLVDEHMANQGQCPDDLETLGASSVIGTDGSLALGSNKGGRCRLEITLPSTAGTLSHQRLWLDREADGRWVCGADFDGKYLPASCRYPALPGPGA